MWMNERVSEQKDVTDIVKDFQACNKHYLLLDTTIKRTFLLKFLLLARAYIAWYWAEKSSFHIAS